MIFFVVDSNSERAFRVLENFDWIICFCFEVIAFFVCYFSLLYATFCPRASITRSVSCFSDQTSMKNYCLFVSQVISSPSVRAIDAKSGCQFLFS